MFCSLEHAGHTTGRRHQTVQSPAIINIIGIIIEARICDENPG